jgi:hypothetical protein
MAQGVGPMFKPQYSKKKKTKYQLTHWELYHYLKYSDSTEESNTERVTKKEY